MKFYHVSRRVSEGDTLNPSRKPLQETAKLISNYPLNSYTDVVNCYLSLQLRDVMATTDRPAYKWCCEALFEHIRKKEFPNRPSRLKATFLFGAFDDALGFLLTHRNEPIKLPNGDLSYAKIFETNDIDPEDAFALDMWLYEAADQLLEECFIKLEFNDTKYQQFCSIARSYWLGATESTKIKEYLTEQSVVLGKDITPRY